MQLPQSVFGIRSNAVVFFKQHTARAWRVSQFEGLKLYFPANHVVLFVNKWRGGGGVLKVLKCCPRFPLRRQNKDTEATWSTPRTAPAHVNVFIRKLIS